MGREVNNMKNKECFICGKELIGRQKMYCSDLCQRKGYYSENIEKRLIYAKEYRNNNRDSIIRLKKEYDKNNKDKTKKYYQDNKIKIKKYAEDNKEKRQEYVKDHYKKNKEKIKEKSKKYYKENRDKKIEYQREYVKNNKDKIRSNKRRRYREDPIFRLNHNISVAIGDSLKESNLSKNRRHWEDIVGYDKEDLQIYLESLFEANMTWDNYGKWHIDHIIPLSFFKYKSTDDVEFKYCWSLNNLQPLWAEENLNKKDRIMVKYFK